MLKPAVSSRNMVSLALVAMFFGVYVASGGTVTSVPNLQGSSDNFGGITPKTNYGQVPASREARPTATGTLGAGQLPATHEPAATSAAHEIDPDIFGAGSNSDPKASVVEHSDDVTPPANANDEYGESDDDGLAAIERRLKITEGSGGSK